MRAPLARWFAFLKMPPEPWWIAVRAAGSKGLFFTPEIAR
jgi:hypothetical protein